MSSEDLGRRNALKMFEDLKVWQKAHQLVLEVYRRQEMTYPLIPIYSLLPTKLMDVFGNDANKVLQISF